MIKYLLGVFALMLVLPACQPKEDVQDEIMLEVSEQTITFAKDAAEKSVSITTNSTSWSYVSPQDGEWLTLTQDGSTLKVKASANPLGADRTGSIVVLAGDKQKRITVRQTAADVAIDITSEAITFTSDGGRQQIPFTANGSVTVELATSTSWLTLSDIKSNSFVVTAASNTTKEKRSAKVNIIAGSTVHEIEVVQDGIMYYVLPILKVPARVREILEAEQARGSIVSMLPDGLFNPTAYRLLTKSSIMPVIEYNFASAQAKKMASASVLCEDPTLVINNTEFDAFMVENGFTKVGTAYENVGDQYRIDATLEQGPAGAAITFKIEEKQTQAYATFTALPLEAQKAWLASVELNITGHTREQVTAWEATQNTTLFKRYDSDKHDIYKVEGMEISHRGYFFYKKSTKVPEGSPFIDQLSELRAFADISRALWQDSEGKYLLTNEFKALMNANNIPFLRELSNNAFAFYSDAQKMAWIVRPWIEDGNLFLDYHVFRVDLGEGSSLSLAHTKDNEVYKKRIKLVNDKLTSRLFPRK